MKHTSFGILALVTALGTACEPPAPAGDESAATPLRDHADDAPEPSAEDSGHDVQEGDVLVLTLESRSGTSALGWSFAAGGLVPAEQADLLLSSFDCGARGRWVQLVAADGELCTSESEWDWANGCADELEVGGSDPVVELDALLTFVDPGGQAIDLLLQDRTATPFEWYEADDLSFEVALEVLRVGR